MIMLPYRIGAPLIHYARRCGPRPRSAIDLGLRQEHYEFTRAAALPVLIAADRGGQQGMAAKCW